MKSAEFADSSTECDGNHKAFGFYEACYGESYLINRCVEGVAEKHLEKMQVESSSDSSSSESESTHADVLMWVLVFRRCLYNKL